jgi:hypothetical protein
VVLWKIRKNKGCIVMKKRTRVHSDLDGISRIEFEDSIEDKGNLAIYIHLRCYAGNPPMSSFTNQLSS